MEGLYSMCRCNSKAHRREQHIQEMQLQHALKERDWIDICNNIVERFKANCVPKGQGRNNLIERYYKAERMIEHHKRKQHTEGRTANDTRG